MNNEKAIKIFVGAMLIVSLGFAADKKEPRVKAADQPEPQGALFSTNPPAAPGKPAPFSAEVSADFIKKVMETSARIEECKKQIAERQAYLYESNPKIKGYRQEMIEMQTRINKLLENDKELAEMRLNRDILWTTMPALPKPREPQLVPPAGAIRK